MSDTAESHQMEQPEARRDVVEGAEAERSVFAVHRDPSLTTTAGGERFSRVGRGIAWVRPTDLIASSASRIAGRGIDLQAELAHRVRRAPGHALRASRDSVRNLKDRRADRTAPEESSVFESFNVLESPHRRRSSSWVRPSGIGLG